MAKTEDPRLKKFENFEAMLEAPQGISQKSFKLAFRLVGLLLWPLSKVWPLSMGADYGKISNIYKKSGSRNATEFGLSRLDKYSSKLSRIKNGTVVPDQVKAYMAWILLSRTLEFACLEPLPEDEAVFRRLVEHLGPDTKGEAPSEALCLLARLAWKLGKQDEAWEWTEKARRVNADNADAHYLKGWFGALLEKGNPVECLFKAVELDPDLLRNMRQDEALQRFPDFISAVEARAKKAGILVV